LSYIHFLGLERENKKKKKKLEREEVIEVREVRGDKGLPIQRLVFLFLFFSLVDLECDNCT